MNKQKKTGITEMHQTILEVNIKKWYLSIVFAIWVILFLVLYKYPEFLFKNSNLSAIEFIKQTYIQIILTVFLIFAYHIYSIINVQTILNFTKNENKTFLQLLKDGLNISSFLSLLVWVLWVPIFVVTYLVLIISIFTWPLLLIASARVGDNVLLRIPKYALLVFLKLNKALGNLYIYLLISLKAKDFEIKDFFNSVFVYQRSYFDPIKWIVPLALIFLTIPFLLIFAFFKLFALIIVLFVAHYVLNIITVYSLTQNPKYYGINIGLIQEKIISKISTSIK